MTDVWSVVEETALQDLAELCMPKNPPNPKGGWGGTHLHGRFGTAFEGSFWTVCAVLGTLFGRFWYLFLGFFFCAFQGVLGCGGCWVVVHT